MGLARRLFLKDKTGFEVNDIFKPIVIRDFRGILFYSTEGMTPNVARFNLPAGEYYIDSGNFRALGRPNQVTLSTLPFPERFYPSSENFKIAFGTNPHKCTIFWKEKLILFDNAFKEKPLSYIDLILFHERGHSLYKTEKYADLYATNEMLKKGYNESQIGTAHLESLSPAQYERKEYINRRIIRRNTYAK